MQVVMPLNIWANRCGHFFNGAYNGGPDVNNGYNCDHENQEEVYNHIGCCYAHSCPTAYPADGKICACFGVDCDDCGNEECECENEMMVCEISDNKFDERYMYRKDGKE